jgi:hypothetical protein
VEALLTWRADPALRNLDGLSAKDVALHHESWTCVDFLSVDAHQEDLVVPDFAAVQDILAFTDMFLPADAAMDKAAVMVNPDLNRDLNPMQSQAPGFCSSWNRPAGGGPPGLPLFLDHFVHQAPPRSSPGLTSSPGPSTFFTPPTTNVNLADALHHACRAAHPGAALSLVAAGVNVRHTNADGLTALHLATVSGHTSVLRALLEADPVLLNQPNTNGETPLLYGCIVCTAEDPIIFNALQVGTMFFLHPATVP